MTKDWATYLRTCADGNKAKETDLIFLGFCLVVSQTHEIISGEYTGVIFFIFIFIFCDLELGFISDV